MKVKTLKQVSCKNVGDVIDVLLGIDRETPLECFCSDAIEVVHSCNEEDESQTWVEIDS